jgi:alpha-1,3-mannosyltransferase
LRIFLVGAAADVVSEAAEALSRSYPRHAIVGHHHGFIGALDDARICGLIRAARADVVLVAMGNPLQELWIERNAVASGAKLLIGVGALFDFLAGRVPRAPKWVRKVRCEWVYRLLCEPHRLWRRYLLGNVEFIASILGERTRGYVRSPEA